MSWLGRLDVIVLVLVFAYIVVVVARVSHRCHLARRTPGVDTSSQTFQLSRRKLAADLTIEAGSLKSIASAAPYLGLAGTCVGILGAFRGVGMEKHAAMLMFISYISAAPITTAAGILVAVPATSFYNYLCTRIERIENEISLKQGEAYVQRAGRFPLNKSFSALPFALVATPSLAIVVAAFTAFSPSNTPKGLSVLLLPIGALDTGRLSVKPVVIGIMGKTCSGAPTIYVNSMKTRSDELGNRLRNELGILSEAAVYVQAEDSVPWGQVMDVIDVIKGLRLNVILLTARPSSPHLRTPGQTLGLKAGGPPFLTNLRSMQFRTRVPHPFAFCAKGWAAGTSTYRAENRRSIGPWYPPSVGMDLRKIKRWSTRLSESLLQFQAVRPHIEGLLVAVDSNMATGVSRGGVSSTRGVETSRIVQLSRRCVEPHGLC